MIQQSKRVIVSPLDWGLGHAARCIPIISGLLQKNAEVYLAGSGEALELLRAEFPFLKFFLIAAYRPIYPEGSAMVTAMAKQLPHFIRTIEKENQQLRNLVADLRPDAVISDNRFGFYHPDVTSVFITHQVDLLMPPPYSRMAPMVNFFNRRQIRKFDQCWIPADDNHMIPALLASAGSLNTRYIGNLSRLKHRDIPKKRKCIAVLSGPSPQREILCGKLKTQLLASGVKAMIVRGEVTGSTTCNQEKNITEVNYLTAENMNLAIAESDIVIARPGYSTVMDLQQTGSKAIFIPTPGQTEQEYIGRQLHLKKTALCVAQDKFDLPSALEQSSVFTGFRLRKENDLLDKALNDLLWNGKN